MHTNELIYDPEQDRLHAKKVVDDIEVKLTLYRQINDTLIDAIKQLQSCNDYDSFVKVYDFVLIKLQFLYDNWPWTRSKTKLFVVDFEKFVSRTKKCIKLKESKLQKLVSDYEIEQQRLDQEITGLCCELSNAKLQYDRFVLTHGDWELQIKPEETIKLIVKDDHINITPAYFKPKQWYAWPNDLEYITKHKFKSKDVGIGSGENWLAYIFGGTVQGQSSTFDLAINVNDTIQKWEVKEYDESSLIVRLGSHGTNSTTQMSLEICDIMLQLKTFSETFEKLFGNFNFDFQNATRNQSNSIINTYVWIKKYVGCLNKFLEQSFSKIVIRGEISNNDLQELTSPIIGAQEAFKYVSTLCTEPYIHLVIGTSTISLDYEQKLQLTLLFADKLSDEELLHALIGTLRHPVLTGQTTYKQFLQDWTQNMTPSSAFSNVDGVFLVHKNGFLMIPNNQLDECFDYVRMTQGRRPNFKIKNIEIPIEKNTHSIGFFGHAYVSATTIDNVIPTMPASSLQESYMTDDELFVKHSKWQAIHYNQIWQDKTLKILPPI